MGFKEILKRIFLKSEDVLFSPEKCICCGREKSDESSPFCDACKVKIKFISGTICEKCGKPINAGKVCDVCKHTDYQFDKARAIVCYDESSSSMITRFKYAGARYLEKRLTELLCLGYKQFDGEKIDLVTYVPMTAKKLKERGYNQTELLANRLCESLKLPCYLLLEKQKDTPAQAGLDKEQRRDNLKGVFAFNVEKRKLIKGKNILIIDDVFTTGATASECAKVLKKAGAGSIFVLTIAKTV